MFGGLKQLDQILRGEATAPDNLREGKIQIPASRIVIPLIVLGALYGLCAALFTVIDTQGAYWKQLVSSAIKVPLHLLATLIVTLPSLYVFNALVGSRLSVLSVVRLLVAAIGVLLAVLASLGPILAFFAISTKSYNFIVLLNVAVYTVSGVLGLSFLFQTLRRLSIAQMPELPPIPAPPPSAPVEVEPITMEEALPPGRPSALDRLAPQMAVQGARAVFRIWVIVFALVGAQMGWVMRPFIGSPTAPFEWFRASEGNFFESVVRVIQGLLGITGGRW